MNYTFTQLFANKFFACRMRGMKDGLKGQVEGLELDNW